MRSSCRRGTPFGIHKFPIFVAICIDLVSLTSIICSQGYIQIALCEPGVKGIKDDLYTVEIPQDKSQDTQVSLGGKSWRELKFEVQKNGKANTPSLSGFLSNARLLGFSYGWTHGF